MQTCLRPLLSFRAGGVETALPRRLWALANIFGPWSWMDVFVVCIRFAAGGVRLCPVLLRHDIPAWGVPGAPAGSPVIETGECGGPAYVAIGVSGRSCPQFHSPVPLLCEDAVDWGPGTDSDSQLARFPDLESQPTYHPEKVRILLREEVNMIALDLLFVHSVTRRMFAFV